MSRELAVAAGLIVADQPTVNTAQVDANSLITLLCRNRVPAAVLSRAHALAASDPAGPFASYLRKQENRLDRSLEAYSEVAAACADAEIAAVLIKSPGYFPYTSSNVDVLVAREHATEACRILMGLGYAELELAREPHKRLFRKLQSPHVGFPIHVHTGVAWINRFLDGTQVLAAHRVDEHQPLLLYPSADDVALITTAHWLYEDKEVSLRDLYHLSLAISDGADWAAIRCRSEETGWRSGLEFALGVYSVAARKIGAKRLASEIPDPQLSPARRRAVARLERQAAPPLQVPKLLAKTLQVVKSLRTPERRPAARAVEAAAVAYFAVRAKRPSIRFGPPVVVGVSGPDGAGKTTLALALKAFLEDEVGVAAGYHWRRLGVSPGLDIIRVLARHFIVEHRGADKTGGKIGAPLKEWLVGRQALRCAWAHTLAAEFLAHAWVDHVRLRTSGGIQIFDRGPIDAEVDLAAMYSTEARWLTRLAPRTAVQLLVVPEPSASDGRNAYAQFEAGAHAVLRARDPLEGLVERSAQEVLRAYIAVGTTK